MGHLRIRPDGQWNRGEKLEWGTAYSVPKVQAVQMDASFQLMDRYGKIVAGKPGDWVVRGMDGEMALFTEAAFGESFNLTDPANIEKMIEQKVAAAIKKIKPAGKKKAAAKKKGAPNVKAA